MTHPPAPATGLRRRTVLASGAAAALAACASGPPARADAPPLALLNRVTWGADGNSLRTLARQGTRDWLGTQLHPAPDAALPAPAQAQIDAMQLATQPAADWARALERQRRATDAIAADEGKRAAQRSYQQQMDRLAREAATTTLLRALYAPNQLQEQLTWFWFNHFNVYQYKANLRVLVGDYEAGLRRHALGRFGDLLVSSALHAAMIRYLDNEQNAARRINENYARELMELHTLGVDGGYSQADVQEMARVLTGLGVNLTDQPPRLPEAQQRLYRRVGLTEFNPARHDMGEKTVLGRRVAGAGWDEILQQLDLLARHPATARHVSRRLAQYFVADDPPPALVARMAGAFERSAGDIAVTLQAMFDDPAFTASLGRKFKDPVHYVVSALRLAHEGRVIANPAPALGWINRLGQGLYNRPTPDGYPLEQDAWAGSGQMATRFEIARAIGNGTAGLFRTGVVDGAPAAPTAATAPASPPAPPPPPPAIVPVLSAASLDGALQAALGERTRAALAGAKTPQEWNLLLLSSPEFMFR